MIIQDFLFRKCRRLPSEYPLSSSLRNMNYTQNNIVMGLVGGDNNIFVMEEKQVFSKHLGL